MVCNKYNIPNVSWWRNPLFKRGRDGYWSTVHLLQLLIAFNRYPAYSHTPPNGSWGHSRKEIDSARIYSTMTESTMSSKNTRAATKYGWQRSPMISPAGSGWLYLTTVTVVIKYYCNSENSNTDDYTWKLILHEEWHFRISMWSGSWNCWQ